jgi:hypothetical protein
MIFSWTSNRWIGASLGASKPSLTRPPRTSKTVTVMLSAMTIASPHFRLSTNMTYSSLRLEKPFPLNSVAGGESRSHPPHND